MPGFGALAWKNDKDLAEQYIASEDPAMALFRAKLYARQVHAKYSLGTVLFYRHDTWHRGTPITPNTLRLVMNVTIRRADCEHISTLHRAWCWSMYSSDMFLEKFIATCSVAQRTLLGFPKPGHRYWTPNTVVAVAARYQVIGMDMRPYIEALQARAAKA